MLVDVLLVLDALVPHLLLQIVALGSQIWKAIDYVFHQVETVEIVLDPHVEGRRDRALFLVASHVQISVRSAVSQSVNQPRISMKAKDDVFVFGEERVVVQISETVGMLSAAAAAS